MCAAQGLIIGKDHKICYNEIMRWAVFIAVFWLFAPSLAVAQNEDLDIVDEPICFAIVNNADYTVLGNLLTDFYTRPDGIRARHRSNFRLHAKGSVSEHTGEPSDRAEFCSYGPFLPNRMLTLTLRSLVPVFECKTRVDTGQLIMINGKRRADDTGVHTWADCVSADGSIVQLDF